jgi:hypothetical protein
MKLPLGVEWNEQPLDFCRLAGEFVDDKLKIMPAIRTGILSFGLVSIPVTLGLNPVTGRITLRLSVCTTAVPNVPDVPIVPDVSKKLTSR